MLTKNGRKWLGANLNSAAVRYKDVDGEEKALSATNITASTRVVIGTGSTVETADDYKMESMAPEGMDMITNGYDIAKDNYTVQYTTAYTNSTGKAVTVKEIGLQTLYRVSASENTKILTFRKTIDPVKIPAGGIKTFTVALL